MIVMMKELAIMPTYVFTPANYIANTLRSTRGGHMIESRARLIIGSMLRRCHVLQTDI